MGQHASTPQHNTPATHPSNTPPKQQIRRCRSKQREHAKTELPHRLQHPFSMTGAHSTASTHREPTSKRSTSSRNKKRQFPAPSHESARFQSVSVILMPLWVALVASAALLVWQPTKEASATPPTFSSELGSPGYNPRLVQSSGVWSSDSALQIRLICLCCWYSTRPCLGSNCFVPHPRSCLSSVRSLSRSVAVVLRFTLCFSSLIEWCLLCVCLGSEWHALKGIETHVGEQCSRD